MPAHVCHTRSASRRVPATTQPPLAHTGRKGAAQGCDPREAPCPTWPTAQPAGKQCRPINAGTAVPLRSLCPHSRTSRRVHNWPALLGCGCRGACWLRCWCGASCSQPQHKVLAWRFAVPCCPGHPRTPRCCSCQGYFHSTPWRCIEAPGTITQSCCIPPGAAAAPVAAGGTGWCRWLVLHAGCLCCCCRWHRSPQPTPASLRAHPHTRKPAPGT